MLNTLTITIPRPLVRKGDLVVITRSEYENFFNHKKKSLFVPSLKQRQALKRAEDNLRQGKTISYDEFASKLDITD